MPVDKLYFVTGVEVILRYDTLVDFVNDKTRDNYIEFMVKRQRIGKCECPGSCKFQLEQALRDLLWEIMYSDEEHLHTLDHKDEYDQDCPYYEEPHIHCILGIKTDELDFTKPETTQLGVPWKGNINTVIDDEDWLDLTLKYPILQGCKPEQFMTSYCYDDH